MNGVQYAALRAAQRGDWTLADAIEVQHRVVHDGAVAGLVSNGRLAFVVYPDVESLSTNRLCSDCAGSGWSRALDEQGQPTNESDGVCLSCLGQGEHFDEGFDWLDPDVCHAVTLNGDAVDLESLTWSDVLTLDDANATIYGYALDLTRAPQQGALFDLKAA